MKVDVNHQLFSQAIDLSNGQEVMTSLMSTGPVKWDGTRLVNAASADTLLPDVGSAGTYTKVTTDAKGRVSSGTSLILADLPAIPWSKLTSIPTSFTPSAHASTHGNGGSDPITSLGSITGGPNGSGGEVSLGAGNASESVAITNGAGGAPIAYFDFRGTFAFGIRGRGFKPRETNERVP